MPVQRLLLAVDHSSTFDCAGFAHVFLAQPPSGAAGGWRRTTAWAAAIEALAAALGAGSGPVVIVTANPKVAALVGALRAAVPPEGLIAKELAAWERLVKAAAGRPLGFEPATAGAQRDFAAAWAELARERAKARGDFQSPIPKPNLAKLPA
jgi:hypothetical protein